MERFKKIALLYAGPGDRNTLQRAVALASRNQAPLLAVAVSPPLPGVVQVLLGRERAEQLADVSLQNLQRALAEDLAQLGLDPVPLHLRSGDPAVETIRFLLQEGCDLLVKGRDKPARGEAVTTTDKKLLRKCPVPLLLLKKAGRKKFSRILAAVDPDPSQAVRHDLQHEVLRLARSLAAREKAELDILHAWDSFATTTLQGPRFRLTEPEIRTLAEEERQVRQAWLEELVAAHRTPGATLQAHLVQGPAARTILDFVRSHRVDLVVMGSIARGGLPGLLIGNTAEGVLDHLNCSTLTIKPADFQCPVRP